MSAAELATDEPAPFWPTDPRTELAAFRLSVERLFARLNPSRVAR